MKPTRSLKTVIIYVVLFLSIFAIVIEKGYGCSPCYTPTTPGGLNATAVSSSQIDLEWNHSSYETSYKIYRSADGTNYSYIGSSNADFVTYSDTGLSSSTTYWYKVRAYNAACGYYSDYSNVDSATTDPTTSPTVVNADATNITDTSATLNGEVTTTGGEAPTVTVYWGDNDGGTTPGNWDNADNIGTQSSTFIDNINPLTGDTTYYFRAYASNSAGNDWADSTAQFNTQSPDTNPPTPDPATFDSGNPPVVTETTITLTATTADPDNSEPVEYQFVNTTIPGHDSSWQTSTTYLDTGLAPNTSYTYTIQMKDAVGNTTGTSSISPSTAPDITKPTPNPATFLSAPSADSDTSISMTATMGTDASGPVEYLFTETTGGPGATDGTWQTSASYTDSGLDPSTLYTYTVQMRDSSPAQNTGTESTPANATTDADTDADDDGMPDSWENVYGLDATDPNDADDDEDQDDLTNLQEFQYETNPRVSDTDGDGVDDGWEVGYSANFYQAGVQEVLNPAIHDAHEKVVDGIPAIWWYTWWTYCNESADSTIQDMYSYFEPSTDNASEDTYLDDDGFTNLTEYQNGTNPVDEDNSSDYWTENTYDDTNNLEKHKQWVYDRVTQAEVCISETVTYYDDLGRPWRTRQKSNPDGSANNAKDAITLIKYYVNGRVEETIRKRYAANTNDAAKETGDVVVTYTYDALGRQYLVTDAGGDVTTYHYSTTTGLLDSVTLPAKSGDSRSMSYIYDEVGRVTATINPEGNYQISTYDSMNRVIKNMLYETVGTIDDPLANDDDIPVAQHRMEYDNLGTLVKDVVMADASSTSDHVVSTDRVMEMDINYSDPNKTQLASIFSDVGKVTASQWSESDVNRDATGKGLPTLIRSGYSEDYSTQPTTDQQMVYDASGRIVTKTIAHFDSRDAQDPTHSYMTKMVYDGYGRLVASISDPDGDPNTTTGDLRSEFVYWGNRKVELIDPEGNKIIFEYNAFGQMETKTEDDGGLARVTEYKYDRLGNLKKITADDDNNSGNGVQMTQYAYDNAGNVTQITYPTGTITYVYDDPAAGGIPTKRTDQNNIETVYTYDKQGNLTQKQNDDTSPTIVEKYTYDARGLMLTAKKGTVADDDATSASVFNYNGLRHLDYTTQSIKGEAAREVDYDHNQIGKPIKITYPDTSDTEIAYSYTSLVMIDEIHRDPDGTPVLLVDYDYAGSMITGRSYTQSSVVFTPLYDNYGRVERHTTENSSGVGTDFEYSYDDNSNITDKIFHHRDSQDPPSNIYGYDDLNRLTTSDYLVGDASNWDEAFGYDLLGNRDEWFKDGTSQGTYTHDSTNAYTSVLSESVSHDDSGNLTADHRGYSYEYDYENRLTRIYEDIDSSGGYNSGDTNIAEFVYDALGRRIEKFDAIGSETTRFYYDDQRVLLEADWNGSTETDERYFVYGNYIDEVLVMTDGLADTPDDHYYGHDHLYSTVVVFDDTGTVEERYEYDAYGNCSVLDADLSADADGLSDFANPYLFTGRRLDTMDTNGSLKLQYSRARYYDPETGRFMSRDPLGIDPGAIFVDFLPLNQYNDGMSLYEYAKSNPSVWIDYTGMFKCPPGTKVVQVKTPRANGCAPLGKKYTKLINWLGVKFGFEGACNGHDICYGTCTSDRSACDKALRSKMRQACKNKHHKWWNPYPINKKLQRCYAMADAFYYAVAIGGKDPFDAAQDEHCDCKYPRCSFLPSASPIPPPIPWPIF